MFVEITVGWLTNSLGLISDAGHMFFDNASLFIGLYASYMARWAPDERFTYGYARYEVLAGFVNAVFLVFVALSVVFEAAERLAEPPEIHGEHVLLVSVLGLGVNVIGLVFFGDAAHAHGGHGHAHGGHVAPPPAAAAPTAHGHAHAGGDDAACEHGGAATGGGAGGGHHGHSHGGGGGSSNENMRGVWLHILADALGSVGVIISSVLIQLYGWNLADPLVSLLISIMILASTVPLITATAGPLLSRAPDGREADLRRAVDAVARLPGVRRVEQPHFWKHHADVVVGTLHVILTPVGSDGGDDAGSGGGGAEGGGAAEQRVLRQARAILRGAGVHVVTVQVEREAEGPVAVAPGAGGPLSLSIGPAPHVPHLDVVDRGGRQEGGHGHSH